MGGGGRSLAEGSGKAREKGSSMRSGGGGGLGFGCAGGCCGGGCCQVGGGPAYGGCPGTTVALYGMGVTGDIMDVRRESCGVSPRGGGPPC